MSKRRGQDILHIHDGDQYRRYLHSDDKNADEFELVYSFHVALCLIPKSPREKITEENMRFPEHFSKLSCFIIGDISVGKQSSTHTEANIKEKRVHRAKSTRSKLKRLKINSIYSQKSKDLHHFEIGQKYRLAI